MALLRFEPIAAQIGKLASPAKLFPREVVERVQRGELEIADPAWGPELRDFMAHYTAVVRAGNLLLGAPAFERLARLSEAQQKEYQPGGPPLSPVYDSYAMQHILAEVPQGLAGETPYSVLARLCSGDAVRARLCELAQALAVSHLDLYRVMHATASGAELAPLRGGNAVAVQIPGPFLRSGDLVLARVLALGGQRFIAESPYLLAASERDWLEYLERVVLEHGLPAASGRPAPASSAPRSSAPRSSAKLSPKQAARRRKEQKQKAAQHTPQEVIATHLRCGEDESFWLEFIIEAYAGERAGIVRLAGVPDRPESLPHSEFYVPASGEAEPEPPMQRVRRAAIALARREGLLEREARALADTARGLGVKNLELHEADSYLLMAYCTLGARTALGETALELLCRERELDPEEREVVASLERGHFGVLRIEHLQLDEGLDVLDLLRGEQLHVSERSATRQVALGDLVLGWLCDAGAGVWTLEGGVLHVPALLAPAVSDLALQLRDERRAEVPGETPAQGNTALVLPLLAGIQYLRENLPLPALYNQNGDPLQLATARYAVLEPGRARSALSEFFEHIRDGRFIWSAADGTLLAQLELSEKTLVVHVNSLERLQAAKERIELALGDAVRAGLDTLEGDSDALLARARDAGAGPPPLDIDELPPDAVRHVHSLLLEQIKGGFDAPIPAFKGKTLRQVARSKAQGDAVSWLREQERILKRNPQLAGLDLRPLWQELGLEYQGLETDG